MRSHTGEIARCRARERTSRTPQQHHTAGTPRAEPEAKLTRHATGTARVTGPQPVSPLPPRTASANSRTTLSQHAELAETRECSVQECTHGAASASHRTLERASHTAKPQAVEGLTVHGDGARQRGPGGSHDTSQCLAAGASPLSTGVYSTPVRPAGCAARAPAAPRVCGAPTRPLSARPARARVPHHNCTPPQPASLFAGFVVV